MGQDAHPAEFTGKRPWIHVFNFCWLVYPSGELPSSVFLCIFSCEPHEHSNTRTHEHPKNTPSNQLPGAVSCVQIPETLFGLWAYLQRQFCPGLPGPHCLLLSLKDWLIWAAFRSIWALSQDTSMGWERRLSKKGRAWGEVSCHQLSPLNCTQSTRVTLGVSAVHTTGRDSPKRHLCDYANNTNERGTAKKGSGRQDPDITLRANLLPLEAGWLFSQSERQPG